MTKHILRIVSIILLFASVISCINRNETLSSKNEIEMPVASKPMVVSWYRMRYPFDKSEAVYQLERMLNVTFDIVRSDDEDKMRKRDRTGVDVFVGGDGLSHVFNYATHIMKDDIRVRSEMFFVAESASAIPLGEQTLLSPEEIRQYMPKTYAYVVSSAKRERISEDAMWRAFSFGSDIVGIPVIDTSRRYPKGIVWRKDILDRIGMDVPQTLDEWNLAFERASLLSSNAPRYALAHNLIDFPVFASYGIANSQWMEMEDEYIPWWRHTEFSQALVWYYDWTNSGFLYPSSSFNWTRPSEYNPNFIDGRTIVAANVPHTDGNWICEEPFVPGSIQDLTRRDNPSAHFVLGPYPASNADSRPVVGVESVFTGRYIAFGSHLSDDREKLHRIMMVVEALHWDPLVFLAAQFGVEDTNWQWSEKIDERSPDRIDGHHWSERAALGIGKLWRYTDSTLSERWLYDPRTLNVMQTYTSDHSGIYSRDKIEWHVDRTSRMPLEDGNTHYFVEVMNNSNRKVCELLSEEHLVGSDPPLKHFEDLIEAWESDPKTKEYSNYIQTRYEAMHR